MGGIIFFFKQKTADEMRISDWSSDVCSSDLRIDVANRIEAQATKHRRGAIAQRARRVTVRRFVNGDGKDDRYGPDRDLLDQGKFHGHPVIISRRLSAPARRSDEHTSELQSLMRISYAVLCLKKKNNRIECK